MATVSREELEKNNGKDGNATFVAVGNVVYDLSASPRWKDGVHMGQHQAGGDLTEALKRAPHGVEVMERYKKVGELALTAGDARSQPAAATQEMPWLVSLMIALRSHPISIHFPQALFVFAPIFLTLFYVAGDVYADSRYFERTAFFLLVAALITAIPATITGFVHWWFKFGGSSRPAFKLKIVLSPLLIVIAAVTAGLHLGKGELPLDQVNIVMLILYWIQLPIATVLGKVGGNIVFGGGK